MKTNKYHLPNLPGTLRLHFCRRTKIIKEVDEVVAVLIPEEFYGVDAFYENFEQVSDEEVMFYLNKLRELRMAGQIFFF